MRFALFYEIPVARPWDADSERLAYQHTIEQAVAGERYGWDAFWTVEHHFLEEYSHCSNPEVLYGAIAALTERMRLGFGVRLMPKPYNHPVRTAEAAAVLDLISNGRVDFGTGRSSTRLELEGFGIDPQETRGMWQEAIEHVVGCWTNDEYEFEGEHWSMPKRRVLPKPIQKPHPPLWGATSLGGRPPPGRRARPRPVLVRGRRAAGGGEGEDRHLPRGHRRLHRADRRVRARPGVDLHDGAVRADRARRRGTTPRESFEWYPKAGARLIATMADLHGRRGSRTSAPTPTPPTCRRWPTTARSTCSRLEYLAEAGACVLGTPEECIETCKRYEAAGVDQLLCLVNPYKIPHESVMQTIQMMGEHVIPSSADRRFR